MSRQIQGKSYIGDGVYIKDEGFKIVLTTEDGVSVKNEIHIEPMEFKAIVDYVKRMGWSSEL